MPFTGRLEFKGGDLTAHPSFIVASMFTSSHRDFATRLATSLTQLGLPFAIYEVPTVHLSISPRGSTDPAYTKANFISYVLGEFHTPVLFVDSDCVFRTEPKRIQELIANGVDFAIYNWLADEHTDAFGAVYLTENGGNSQAVQSRLYRFLHAVDWFAPEQLICSGAVQFYSCASATLAFLHAWSQTIQEFHGAQDDHCLDRTFNFLRPVALNWHWAWFDKAYSRNLWWIYVRPVIDHPQFPAGNDPAVVKILGPVEESPLRWSKSRAETRSDGRLFPRDAIIDVDRGLILRPGRIGGPDGQIKYAPYAPLQHELFLA